MKYVLPSSGISWNSGALIVRYRQKKECVSFVFYCFENISNAITLEPLVQFRWGFPQNVGPTSSNEDYKQMENGNCQMFDFR